jgi:hypothetical protein
MRPATVDHLRPGDLDKVNLNLRDETRAFCDTLGQSAGMPATRVIDDGHSGHLCLPGESG